MAAAGVPMRTLQEWMGHRDLRTTLIYADYRATPCSEFDSHPPYTGCPATHSKRRRAGPRDRRL